MLEWHVVEIEYVTLPTRGKLNFLILCHCGCPLAEYFVLVLRCVDRISGALQCF